MCPEPWLWYEPIVENGFDGEHQEEEYGFDRGVHDGTNPHPASPGPPHIAEHTMPDGDPQGINAPEQQEDHGRTSIEREFVLMV